LQIAGGIFTVAGVLFTIDVGLFKKEGCCLQIAPLWFIILVVCLLKCQAAYLFVLGVCWTID